MGQLVRQIMLATESDIALSPSLAVPDYRFVFGGGRFKRS
jgi:hypothetical protein